MPGVHWMSIGILTDWLQRHHPEIRGGIIALSTQDLAWPGNGAYELGIVQPFRQASDREWIEAHVPFDRSQMETWGSRFALFAWRDDVRDFLSHPFTRLNRTRDTLRTTDLDRLFSSHDMPGDMCAWGVRSLDTCERLDAEVDAPENLRRQCREVTAAVKDRPDFAVLARQSPLPDFMQKTRSLVQQQLRGIKWGTPPVVVLMPIPLIWRSDAHWAGMQQWALSILQPLDDEGTIHLVDATGFFDGDAGSDCSIFADFYHENPQGRSRFSAWLIPRLDTMLYAPSRQPSP
ncbi:MAG: hypothetical protein IPH43_15275 [Xanthomonadales bacterium]|nr:hypothetical protein [Xanthomonadales bacterium]